VNGVAILPSYVKNASPREVQLGRNQEVIGHLLKRSPGRQACGKPFVSCTPESIKNSPLMSLA